MKLRAATLLVLIASSTAYAHDNPAERSAVLQVHTAHAELLLIYKEPRGPRVDRLFALYDQNRNGKIDGLETRIARRAFLDRAFYGFDLTFDAKSSPKTAELRYKTEDDGGISVAVLQRIDLIIGKNEMEVGLSLRPGETIPAMDVIVEPAGNWRLPEGDASEHKLALTPGQSSVVKLSRKPSAAPQP